MRQQDPAHVLLCNPKYPHNVGAALRACALLGATTLAWYGERVPGISQWPEGARLPREERLRCYRRTQLCHLHEGQVPIWVKPTGVGTVPVCVEITDSAEDLRTFVHPERPMYVFGPEDGGVPKAVRALCHRFVRIPNAIPLSDPDGRTPYNLAAAVNLVLYDRFQKAETTDG